MHLWWHLLKSNDFDACVDHIILTNIVKSKTLPTSQWIIRLLDLLSNFKLSLYYVKDKDMILVDLLSRIAIDDGNQSKVIHISFNCLTILKDHFNDSLNKYWIATRKSTKESGIKVLKVHGISKILYPHKKPEHQIPVPIIPKEAHPYPIVRSTIRKPTSTQIATRNFIKKSVKQLHKNPKPIKQTKITPTNNTDSQMNDDAISVPTRNTYISRTNMPPVDTDNINSPTDLITPSNVPRHRTK